MEILGKLGEDPQTLQECRRLIEKYLVDPRSLDGRTARSVAGIAAHFGDDALFRKFTERIRSYRSVEQYSNLMIAMSDFGTPDLAQRWLESCFSPATSSLDMVYCITSLIYSPATRPVAWEWVKKQWPRVEAKLSTTTGADIVHATEAFCDPTSRNDVEQFFTAHKIFSSERALQQSLERIDACVRTRNNQQDALTLWLHKPLS